MRQLMSFLLSKTGSQPIVKTKNEYGDFICSSYLTHL